jgi:hypothetical protein
MPPTKKRVRKPRTPRNPRKRETRPNQIILIVDPPTK